MDNSDVEWPRVLAYLEENRKMQSEAMTTCEDGESDCDQEPIAETYEMRVRCDEDQPCEAGTEDEEYGDLPEGTTFYHTWEVQSPLPDITLHTNYNSKFAMFVICGQKGSLHKDIEINLKEFIEEDLTWFQVILLVFNIFIFVAFLFFFESRLQARVTKPI